MEILFERYGTTNVANQFGPRQPWQPAEVARFFSTLTVPWWIAGGWALDLFLGDQTREHEDIDILFLRRDQHEIRAQFQRWDVQEAHPELLPSSWPDVTHWVTKMQEVVRQVGRFGGSFPG